MLQFVNSKMHINTFSGDLAYNPETEILQRAIADVGQFLNGSPDTGRGEK